MMMTMTGDVMVQTEHGDQTISYRLYRKTNITRRRGSERRQPVAESQFLLQKNLV